MDEEPKEGAPAWMVSFGDMMTLILTFFILLVSMSKERQVGLVSKGVGSFVVALRSYGLNGFLDGAEEAQIHEEIRQKFKQVENEKLKERPLDIEDLERLEAEAALALEPVNQIAQPNFAVFDPGSIVLTEESKKYIDLLIPSLEPGGSAVLQLEGHAASDEPGWEGQATLLGFKRAEAVQEYLESTHKINRFRIKPRVHLVELSSSPARSAVDARLTLPKHTPSTR